MIETQADTLPFFAELDLPRVPQQARSRQKRDAILAAASHLFAERGYDATTADDIANAAEVSIGTFYSYFRNKRQAFLTLYVNCLESLFALGIANIDFGDDPQQAIRAVVHRAMRRDSLSYGMRRACAELLPRDEELASWQNKVNLKIYTQVLAATRRVIAQGLTWPDLDVEMTCWYITLLLDQVWQTEPQPGEAPDEEVQRRHDTLADMIYRSIFKPK